MVIDSSAIIAIAADEPDSPLLLNAIEADPTRQISAATLLEASIVWMRRVTPENAERAELDILEIIERLDARIEPVTLVQARLASQAYRRFGKGFHPAGLNYGDCFSYALARELDEPLLFKGRDFSATDIESVL